MSMCERLHTRKSASYQYFLSVTLLPSPPCRYNLFTSRRILEIEEFYDMQTAGGDPVVSRHTRLHYPEVCLYMLSRREREVKPLCNGEREIDCMHMAVSSHA
jgi:hypothetical protein